MLAICKLLANKKVGPKKSKQKSGLFIRRTLISPSASPALLFSSYLPTDSSRSLSPSLFLLFISSSSSDLSVSHFHFFFSPPKMQSSLSLSFSPSSSAATTVSRSHHYFPISTGGPLNLRFCGLRREALGLGFTTTSLNRHNQQLPRRQHSAAVYAALSDNGSSSISFDYDLLIIGAGVGGHGAALHAVEKVSSISIILCQLVTTGFVVSQ